MSIRKQLIEFETHCFETDQPQVGELVSNAIKHIAELEEEYRALRLATLKAIQCMSWGQCKADLRDAYDKGGEKVSDKTKKPQQWSSAKTYRDLNKYCHYCNEENAHRSNCIVLSFKKPLPEPPKEQGDE